MITRECTEILQVMDQPFASQIKGTAFRICQDDATWLHGNWTNYTQCVDSYDAYTLETVSLHLFFLLEKADYYPLKLGSSNVLLSRNKSKIWLQQCNSFFSSVRCFLLSASERLWGFTIISSKE